MKILQTEINHCILGNLDATGLLHRHFFNENELDYALKELNPIAINWIKQEFAKVQDVSYFSVTLGETSMEDDNLFRHESLVLSFENFALWYQKETNLFAVVKNNSDIHFSYWEEFDCFVINPKLNYFANFYLEEFGMDSLDIYELEEYMEWQKEYFENNIKTFNELILNINSSIGSTILKFFKELNPNCEIEVDDSQGSFFVTINNDLVIPIFFGKHKISLLGKGFNTHELTN